MATYHAFPYGKMNQSFKLENENNQSLYEANLVKFKLFSACDYEFINHVTTSSSVRKVGKTITNDPGPMGVHGFNASYFKLDGKNCFDILEEKGYSFKILAKLDLIHPEFALIDRDGNQSAVYRMNVAGPREAGVGAVGNKQSNTVITTESDDLDTVFLGAFILSRVELSLYLV